VYSNKSGYLGGVNLALMLVFVSQRRPNALAFRLVKDFFSTFAKWRWSSHNAMRLDAHVEHECPVWLQSLEWTPRMSESMVVLTACFPRFNTTYSASKYSTGILQRELERANACVDAGRWLDACNELDVFVSCQRFIRVRLQSPNTSSGKTWIGYMQAQTRHLIQLIANEELAIAELRYVARWCETATESGIQAETFVTADDDGKPRSYLVRGNLERPVTYFDATFADAGPARPEGAVVKIGFCTNSSIPEELREYSARASAEIEADVKELVEKNRTLTTAPSTSAVESLRLTCSAKELRTQIRERTVSLQHHLPRRGSIVRHKGLQKARRQVLVSMLPECPQTATRFIRPIVARGQLLTPFDVFIGKSATLGEHHFTSTPGLALPAEYNVNVKEYEDHLLDLACKDASLRKRITAVIGKTIGCWCVPAGKAECHGHALVRVAKRLVAV
jgi:hypothetical protein